jgi:hypothetical protein
VIDVMDVTTHPAPSWTWLSVSLIALQEKSSKTILMAPSPRLNGSFSFSFEERPPPYMYTYNLDHDEDLAASPPTWLPPPRRDLHLVDRPHSSRSTSGRHQRQDRTPTTGTATADPSMTAEEFDALPAAVRRKVRAASSSTVRSFVGTIKTSAGEHRHTGSCTTSCVTRVLESGP